MKLALINIMVLTLFGCGNHTTLKSSNQAFNKIEGVGFERVFNEVFEKNCIECHSSYSNYQIVAQQADRILNAVETGRMPKNRPNISNLAFSVLKSWVENGAPEIPGQAPEMLPLEASYESLIVNIFGPKCLACHSGSLDAPGPASINFSSYENLIQSNLLYEQRFGIGFLDTEFPEDSELIALVTDTSSQAMPPPMLPGNPNYVPPDRVTAKEVEVLIEWISLGFPERK